MLIIRSRVYIDQFTACAQNVYPKYAHVISSRYTVGDNC